MSISIRCDFYQVRDNLSFSDQLLGHAWRLRSIFTEIARGITHARTKPYTGLAKCFCFDL